jgi:hypothetical protein
MSCKSPKNQEVLFGLWRKLEDTKSKVDSQKIHCEKHNSGSEWRLVDKFPAYTYK